jgi:hypothetical protein
MAHDRMFLQTGLDEERLTVAISSSGPNYIAFGSAIEAALRGKPPDPRWAGECTADQFLAAISDLTSLAGFLWQAGMRFGDPIFHPLQYAPPAPELLLPFAARSLPVLALYRPASRRIVCGALAGLFLDSGNGFSGAPPFSRFCATVLDQSWFRVPGSVKKLFFRRTASWPPGLRDIWNEAREREERLRPGDTALRNAAKPSKKPRRSTGRPAPRLKSQGEPTMIAVIARATPAQPDYLSIAKKILNSADGRKAAAAPPALRRRLLGAMMAPALERHRAGLET